MEIDNYSPTTFIDPCRIVATDYISCITINLITNNPGFRLKHPRVPDGSDGCDGTSYLLTEKYMPPVAQVTGRIAYLPALLCAWYAHHQNDTCVALFAGAAVML
jgi:hypothetical protein